MNNTSESFKQVQESLLISNDYDGLLSHFQKETITATQLLIFYKQKIKLISIWENTHFWNSELPHYFLEDMLKSDLKVSFYTSYFKNDDHCNDGLNRHLFYICQEDFIYFLKFSKAYKQPHFFKSISLLSKEESGLSNLVKEADFIIKIESNLRNNELKSNEILSKFSIVDLIICVVTYYQNCSIGGNRNLTISYQAGVLSIFDQLLKTNGVLQSSLEISNSELQQKLNGLDVELYRSFSNSIESILYCRSKQNEISLYENEFADFIQLSNVGAKLKTNSSFQLFQYNNYKSQPEEFYFIEFNFADFGKKMLDKIDISPNFKCLQFYGVPTSVKFKGGELNVEHLLKLLKYFSEYKTPSVKQTILGTEIVMNQPTGTFVETFGGNEAITIFNYEELLIGINDFFKWELDEVRILLDFLTYDLGIKNNGLFWVERPFLKVGNKLIWLGAMLYQRRWDNVLLNRLKNGSDSISKNCEKKLLTIFEDSGFKAIQGLNFKNKNGETGDFDVLAYKDHHLFVCEVKTGIRSDSFDDAAFYETVRLEGCAADQISKALINLDEDWGNIKSKLGIPPDVEFDSVVIVPLIVTDFFEGDLKIYKQKYDKTTMLELEVILKNRKRELLQLYLLSRKPYNYNNPNLKNFKINNNWDLWDGKSEIDVSSIHKLLKSNTIWNDLNDIWSFPEKEFELTL